MKIKSLNLVLLAISASVANAEIVRDGTIGSGDLSVTATENNYAITADMGFQSGGNLFHSFETFNVESGHTATFSGPGSVGNIISRITGNSPSAINGTISSTIPGANFWLINPKGVLFGEGAALDITGSFHVGTADYLQLRDGTELSADTSQFLLLTSSAPHAFGFISEDTISNASLTVQNTRLSVPENEVISLVGSKVTLSAAVLAAPGGQVSVVSINDVGEVYYSDQGFDAYAVDEGGDVASAINFSGKLTLSNTALKVDGEREGNIQIQGGDIEINTNTTDVVPSVSNLKASFYEESDLLEKPCELAEFHGKGRLAFTVDQGEEETHFGVEVKKSRSGALGFIKQNKCL